MQIKIEMTSRIDTRAYVKNNVFNPLVAALNELGKPVISDLRKAVDRDFDNATPYTKRAFVVAQAANADQELPYIVVAALPQQSKYIGLEVYGGPRRVGDYATSKKGIMMPGPDVELNDYGNLPRGYLTRLYARKQAFTRPGRNGSVLVFARYDSKSGAGHNDKRLVAVLNQRAHYNPKLKFFETVGESVATNLPAAWVRVFKRGIRRS
jgi:hypothetical protein